MDNSKVNNCSESSNLLKNVDLKSRKNACNRIH